MRHSTFCLALCAALALLACGDDAGADGDALDAVGPALDVEGSGADGVVDAAEDVLPDEHEIVLALDYQLVEMRDGISEDLIFDIPENTLSTMIIVEGEPSNTYGLAFWEDGQGDELVYAGWTSNPSEDSAPSMCIGCANRVSTSEGAFAALAPNNEQVEVAPGEHRAVLFGYRVVVDLEGPRLQSVTGYVRVTVYAKVGAAPPRSGVLDLNLFFSGAGEWTADSAPNDDAFIEMMDNVQRVYDQAGITLGEMRYYDVDERFQVIEDVDAGEGDLAALFSQSDGKPPGAVNLFFVGELLQGGPFGGFAVVLGISGGIPGPTMTPGTTRSGVAIAVNSHDLAEFTSELHTTVAHEMGHFLGLYHTTELYIGVGDQTHDPIGDTDENSPRYLMFYSGSGEYISNVQGDVMRANPVVRSR